MSILSLAMPDPNDQAVVILQQILGSIVPNMIDPAGHSTAGGTIFPLMIGQFNTLLLGFGTIIFAIMLFVGTMNTAADGQFLGKDWNAVWTPIRLIVGLLFIVPLKGGYCVGQYIFLYIILLGVNLGTNLWKTVIVDTFSHYTPPAVPSYIRNYALSMIEQQMVFDLLQKVVPGSGSSNIPIDIPAGTTITLGQIPPTLQTAVAGVIANDPGSNCSKLYSAPLAQTACTTQLGSFLNTGSGQALSWGDGGAIYFWLGTNGKAYPPSASPASPGDWSILANPGSTGVGAYSNGGNDWLSTPNNQISLTGDYVYNTMGAGNGTPTPVAPGQDKNARDAYQATVTKDIQAYELSTLMGSNPLSNAPPSAWAPTPGTQNYSIDSIQSDAISAVLTSIYDGKNTGTGSNAYANCSEVGGVTSCGLVESPNGEYVYNVEGMSYINGNGEVVTGNSIPVNLNNSWWDAGESYLILDAQFAANLETLSNVIQSFIQGLSPGNQQLLGYLGYNFYYAVAEFGPYANKTGGYNIFASSPTNDANNPIAHTNGVLIYPMSDSNGSYTVETGMGGQAMAVGAHHIIVPVSSTPIDVTSLFLPTQGSSIAWLKAIGPYNPAVISNGGLLPGSGVINPTTGAIATNQVLVSCMLNPYQANQSDVKKLYAALLTVPTNFQISLEVLLNSAQNTCDTSPGGLSPINLVPVLENFMIMFEDNGVMSNADDQEVLPINEAMNSIFSQLLGNGGIKTVATGNAPVGLNTIMQDVYNLGMDQSSNIYQGQFSLIQQVRSAGIEMVSACINSLQDVYTQYKTVINAMLTGVASDTNEAQQGASEASNGWIPLIGPMYAAAGASDVAEATLKMQTLTLTTMSNLGMQMMFLPMLMFVMTSLFTAGIEFALVLPFMPYMMFWGGQMAWIIGVIEAMVAAPLVMLGIAHPGGDHYMGHARPAVKLLIGVVFRPVLMVIGLTVGILLTYVLINYSAQGFHIIADNTLNTLPVQNMQLSGVMSCILLFTYCSFLMMAFTKCFSPIYSIPERVVEWIGGQAAQGGKEEAQQFSQGAQKTAGAAAQAGESSMQKGIQANDQRGQNTSQVSQKSAETNFQVAKSHSDGISGGISAGVSVAETAAEHV